MTSTELPGVAWPRSRSSKLPLPPGPKPLPIIGNLLDMPMTNMAPALHRLSAIYGDLVYLDVVGQPVIVMDRYEDAFALLESRSANTSERPRLVMAELGGLMWEFTLLPYNSTLKRCRRTFHSYFSQDAIMDYRPIHERGVRRFMNNLLDSPEDFLAHARRTLSATIMEVVYGIRVENEDNEYVSIVEKGGRIFGEVVAPGRFLVELLPALAYLPAWMPGAGFKRNAAKWNKDIKALRDAEGSARTSIDGTIDDEDFEHCKDVVGVAYTMSALSAFFLAMVMHPEVQHNAHAELDAVIGPNRLPSFTDREHLPYVDAVMKEITRWHPVLPLGITHQTRKDDVYKGYHIPAGTNLIANNWAMSRDPAVYPDPEKFMPERYLGDAGGRANHKDVSRLLFGYGRRVCPGRHFATDALFIFITSMLYAFEILPPLGADGKPQPVQRKVGLDFLLSFPEPFACRIVPRSLKAEALVKQSKSHV
ncbi:O-methylsterigmatocystin oxidoreductase [Epithele typhae]|uniref:O-methylsterigmatocystin oxidoreductase n=1 Tax=Epithele typhae TaxID=378194 RepID=UPI0020084DC6|nr:O-methylsterigmatocystin oxidoreductase [Epithele typhae]KAH9941591.1 O-methylsterigmatocystin oxidoreductase [Epithele typhae]